MLPYLLLSAGGFFVIGLALAVIFTGVGPVVELDEADPVVMYVINFVGAVIVINSVAYLLPLSQGYGIMLVTTIAVVAGGIIRAGVIDDLK